MPRRSGGGARRSHNRRHNNRHHHHRPVRAAPRIVVPPTTQFTVVFPLKKGAFDTSGYLPIQTDERASLEEVSNVLREINEARMPAHRKTYYINFLYALCLLGVIALSIVGVILAIKNNGIFIGVAIIGGTIFIFIVYGIFTWILNKIKKKEQELAEVVTVKYNQVFASKELSWIIPIHFPMWIELRKDYKYPAQQNLMQMIGDLQVVELNGGVGQLFEQINMMMGNNNDGGNPLNSQQNMGYGNQAIISSNERQMIMSILGENNQGFGNEQQMYQQSYYGNV